MKDFMKKEGEQGVFVGTRKERKCDLANNAVRRVNLQKKKPKLLSKGYISHRGKKKELIKRPKTNSGSVRLSLPVC